MGLNWIEQKSLGLFVKTRGVLSAPFFAGKGLIFMLHRVLPEQERNRFPVNNGLAISPEKLEEHILYFKKMNFEFISMDTLHSRLKNGVKPKKRFVIFTLDDGYKDNFTVGLPIFEKFDIPFTVYVSTCFPNKCEFPWWYLLEDKLSSPGQLTIHSENQELYGTNFTWSSAEEGVELYPKLAEMIKASDSPNTRKYWQETLGLKVTQLDDAYIEMGCTWEDLEVYTKHPLVTIGAHTSNHYCLSRLSLEEAKHEIESSKKELENALNQKIEHFAYPYGGLEDATKRDYILAMEAGFKTAVLNHPGNVFSSTQKNLFSIPRYPLGEATPIQKLNEITNGITHFGANGFSPSYTAL
jgi:peptidoglycan/xylan/chitin deacetylase (PgdA/CDA1 family)